MKDSLIDKIESQIIALTKIHHLSTNKTADEARYAIRLIRQLTNIIFELEDELKKP